MLSQAPTPASQAGAKQNLGNVIEVTDQADFIRRTAADNVMLYYSSKSCSPCVSLGKLLADLSKDPKYTGVKFVKVDLDKLPDLGDEQNIEAVPTVQRWSKGKKLGEFIGFGGKTSPSAAESQRRAATTSDIDALLKR